MAAVDFLSVREDVDPEIFRRKWGWLVILLKTEKGEISDDEVELRRYLQRVADNTTFMVWYFGHFHEDTKVEDMFYCLYDDIVVI